MLLHGMKTGLAKEKATQAFTSSDLGKAATPAPFAPVLAP
jgi:hypothetical protein